MFYKHSLHIRIRPYYICLWERDHKKLGTNQYCHFTSNNMELRIADILSEKGSHVTSYFFSGRLTPCGSPVSSRLHPYSSGTVPGTQLVLWNLSCLLTPLGVLRSTAVALSSTTVYSSIHFQAHHFQPFHGWHGHSGRHTAVYSKGPPQKTNSVELGLGYEPSPCSSLRCN